MKLFFFGFVLHFLIFSPAFAETGGRFAVEGIGFFEAPPSPVESSEARFNLELQHSSVLFRSWSVRAHGVLSGTSAKDSWSSSVIADPKELLVEFQRRGWFGRAGAFSVKWDGTDGLNPMDIAGMKDWSDPLLARTLASAGAMVGYSGDRVDLEIFWVPRQTRSLLPGVGSPWLPRSTSLPLRTEEYEVRLPDRVEYRYLDREENGGALANNGGLRLALRGDSWDAAIAGFEGAADMPALMPVLDVTPVFEGGSTIYQLQSPVFLRPMDYRRRTGAAFFSSTFGEWIFRVASRWDQPLGTDPSLPGWSQQSVAGVERGFSAGDDLITVVVQGSWGKTSDGGGLLSLTDVYNGAALLGVRWGIGEESSVMLSGLRSKDGGSFVQIEGSRRLSERWSSEVFAQLFSGDPSSLLGIFSRGDRAGARMIYAF